MPAAVKELKELKELREFRYIKGGMELSDHRRVILPAVIVEDDAPNGSYKAAMDSENGIGKGCDIWQWGDHLFILWGIMHKQNAAFFCKLKPAPQPSLAVYLDTLAVGASQFAKRKHSVRAKVSHVEAIKGSLVHVSVHLANGWFVSDDPKNYKADEIRYVLNLSSGAVTIVSRHDTTKDEVP